VEGITNMRTLNATMDKGHQWPVDLANPVWSHRGAWWVKRPMWDETFGELQDVEALVHATQFMQADGLRYALEANRRRKFHNSGTIPWQFNEPYPMAACTSAVDYYARPKPAYYAVARAYAPLLISARFNTLAWEECEQFEAEAWVCNSYQQHYRDLTLRMRLIGIDGATYTERITNVSFAANCSTRLSLLQERLTRISEEVFFLDLQLIDSEGALLSQNRYVFSRTANMAPLLACPRTTLSTSLLRCKTDEENEYTLTLKNTGQVSAMFIWLEDDQPLKVPGYVYFDDNYFCLLPSESRLVTVTWKDVPVKEQRLEISGWNTEYLSLSLVSIPVH
jgi:beta-mannosidase